MVYLFLHVRVRIYIQHSFKGLFFIMGCLGCVGKTPYYYLECIYLLLCESLRIQEDELLLEHIPTMHSEYYSWI